MVVLEDLQRRAGGPIPGKAQVDDMNPGGREARCGVQPAAGEVAFRWDRLPPEDSRVEIGQAPPISSDQVDVREPRFDRQGTLTLASPRARTPEHENRSRLADKVGHLRGN